jgi:hypothetical protein
MVTKVSNFCLGGIIQRSSESTSIQLLLLCSGLIGLRVIALFEYDRRARDSSRGRISGWTQQICIKRHHAPAFSGSGRICRHSDLVVRSCEGVELDEVR